jgi:hypothetical protein
MLQHPKAVYMLYYLCGYMTAVHKCYVLSQVDHISPTLTPTPLDTLRRTVRRRLGTGKYQL